MGDAAKAGLVAVCGFRAAPHLIQRKVLIEPVMESEAKALLAARLADDKKATHISILNVEGMCNFADFFVVCTGHSTLQLRAIADAIEADLKKEGVTPLSVQGRGRANWIVLDFGDVVIHVMNEEARSYYALENLWGDARIVPLAKRADSR